MSETTVYRGKWNELGKELEFFVRKNNALPKEERKTLNSIFEEFAEKHDTTPNSASRYYYNEIKSKIEEEPKNTINIDESINNYVNSITTDLRDPRNLYRVGDTLEVEITSIQDFGAFAKTKEGFEGLIHISEITGKHFVDLPEDYFYIGEKCRVKLKRIDNEGRIAFSTRALGGKDKINPAFKDIAKTNMKTESTPIKVAVKEPKLVKVEPTPVIIEEVKPQTHPDDRDNIINFIKKYSDNNVSPKALTDIDEMVAQFGVFQTTISLMEVVRDLDISSFITNLTKEKLGLAGDSLRRN